MEKILVTGPDGFVGYRLCERLLKDGFAVRGAQFAPAPLPDGCESVVVGDLAEADNWNEALAGVDRVVHLAARVHIMDDDAADPLEAFRHVNVEGTRRLAEAAVRTGVKRFVFISSIKVLGEATADPDAGRALSPRAPRADEGRALSPRAPRTARRAVPTRDEPRTGSGRALSPRAPQTARRAVPACDEPRTGSGRALSPKAPRTASEASRRFSADDPFVPEDPYGVSKMEAEQLLRKISQESGMEVTIIRPPLVYGPGVRANFLKLLSVVNKGIPLPFKLIKNQRSLIFLDNLVDFLVCCLSHEKAANEAFLVSDGQDLSTADLVRAIAKAAGRRPMLLPVPPAMMKLAGSLLGKRDQVDRLLGSLAVDISKDWKLLGWHPPVSVEDGLRETMQWFLSENL